MSSRAILRLATIAILLVAASAATPPSASAAEVKIYTCNDAATESVGRSDIGWWKEVSTGLAYSAPFANCPDAIGFDAPIGMLQDQWARWGFWTSNRAQLDAVRFTVTGGGEDPNVSFVLRGCSGCAPLAVLPEPGVGATAEFAVALGVSTDFQITVSCAAVTCDEARWSISDVEVTVIDEVPPKVITTEVWPGWQRSSAVLGGVLVADQDSVGLGWARASIDDRYPYWSTSPCTMSDNFAYGYFTREFPCAPYASKYGLIGMTDLQDGQHVVKVDAVDALGNVMPTYTTTFKTDDTPPDTPEDAAVTPKYCEPWTDSTSIAASWRNPDEAATSPSQSGISLATYDLNPKFPGSDPPAVERFVAGATAMTMRDIALPADGLWDLYLGVVDQVGNRSGRAKITIGRDVDMPLAPQLSAKQWFNWTDIRNGPEIELDQPAQPSLESGICGYAISFNANENSTPAAAITHPGGIDHVVLGGSRPEGVSWMHAMAFSRAGQTSSVTNQRIGIDTVAPVPAISGGGGSEWIGDAHALSISATDATSGVAQLLYTLAGADATVTGGGPITPTLPEGKNTLLLRARDVAGNLSAPVSRDVWLDGTGPVATLEPRNTAAPLALKAWAQDGASGIDSAAIELRRQGGAGSWRRLSTTATPDEDTPGRMQLSAAIPDTELENGIYDVRVNAVDRAGNVSISYDVLQSGNAMTLSLPLRAAGEATALLALDHCGKRACGTTGAKQARTVTLGSTVKLVGDLTRGDGSPIAGRELRIYSRPPQGNDRLLDVVQTDAAGSYSIALPKGSSRRLTARFAGDATTLPAEATADLGVAASAKLVASPNRLKAGGGVRFSGRLKGLEAGNSPRGVLVVLEFRNRGTWQTALGRAKVDSSGRFSVPKYTFRNPLKLKVRAYIRAENSNWPYQDGYSNTVSVNVRR